MKRIEQWYDFSGKVVVVTGGSRGIGRAIAQGFAEAGASVVIASRKYENCVTAAHEITGATGSRTLPVAYHAAVWDQAEVLVDAVYNEFGRCDVLINNAGMSLLYPDLASITEEHYDKVHGVNLKGPFRTSVLAGTRMAAADGGVIINVGTVGSIRPGKSELVYACAKSGLNALTIGLADAFGPNVRANCMMPGPVLTDIADAWTPEMRENAAKANPLQRAAYAEDYVGTALWLASDASSYVNGVLLRVDGGLYKQMSC
jgi:NAD(P)-dependent dehydrogenase (short-subunit alcohol dehydrogenase family)